MLVGGGAIDAIWHAWKLERRRSHQLNGDFNAQKIEDIKDQSLANLYVPIPVVGSVDDSIEEPD